MQIKVKLKFTSSFYFFTTLLTPFSLKNTKFIFRDPGFVSVHLGKLAVEFEIRSKAKILSILRYLFVSVEAMSAMRGISASPIWRGNQIIRQTAIRRFHVALSSPSFAFPLSPVLPPAFTLPKSFFLAVTSIIPIFTGIWDSILRAVPKKKTTHSQKRKRQLIGKALQDKKNLTRCEACGDWKLLHTLCESCVKSIQRDWRNRERIEGF